MMAIVTFYHLVLILCVWQGLASAWLTTFPTYRARPTNRRLPVLLFDTSPAKPFGKREYWQEFYKDSDQDFSWYATWSDMEPFVTEWVSPTAATSILVAGIGSDAKLLGDMIESGGYPHDTLSAFDYAPESIDYCKRMLLSDYPKLDLWQADARSLPLANATVDAVIDKGTLDAVSLAGTTSQEKLENLHQAVREIQRVLRPGGIFWSLSGICADRLSQPEWWDSANWTVRADGSLYTTRDGYTSNNMDGTLLVWQKEGTITELS